MKQPFTPLSSRSVLRAAGLGALLILSGGASAGTSAIDWSQPPVACVEEIVPAMPSRPCLDLSTVVDPLKDFPANMSPDELAYWQGAKTAIAYCRATEVMRRETAAPGTFTPGRLELAWMQILATQHSAEKISAIYEASRDNKLPAQVLSGALSQESLLSELGIAEDGGNYSCGIGQINLVEWCHWANATTGVRADGASEPAASGAAARDARTKANEKADEKANEKANKKQRRRLGWPAAGLSCADLDPALVKPFYDIAKTRLNGSPEYKLNKSHFAGIAYNDVVAGFPNASAATQQLRFNAVQGFINNCSGVHDGVAAKAHELALIYRQFIPAGLKQLGYYPAGQKYGRKCQDEGFAGAHPLNLGWLLAVGAYNAGPRAVDSLAYYYDWKTDDLKNPATFQGMTVVDMVTALYWSGIYDKKTDRIDLTTISGSPTSWLWFKPCVLQRHIARVVQWATLPGTEPLVDTLEGKYTCAKSVFDPKTGDLITSAVPPFRQTSSGRKP